MEEMLHTILLAYMGMVHRGSCMNSMEAEKVEIWNKTDE